MRSTRVSGQMLLIGSKSAHQGAGLFKRTQAPAHTTWFSKLISPPKTQEKEPQHGQNDEQVEGRQRGLIEASGSQIHDCNSGDPLNSFPFFYTDNNTGQMKSASQNNWLSHRASSTIPHSYFFSPMNHNLIFTERPLSCISNIFFLDEIFFPHNKKKNKHI